MSYLLWLGHAPERERLAQALAEVLSLPREAVDVGDGDDESRNWGASAICTVTPLGGDLRLHLDLYVLDEVQLQPSQEIVAALLAARLDTVVAYEAMSTPPSAFWLVGPDGVRTRARIDDDESDEDLARYRIDAVEQPLAALPDVRVAAIPEVILGHHIPTPLTDQFDDRLEPGASSLHTINQLTLWERLVARIAMGWPPDGWYPADYLRADFEARDGLADGPQAWASPLRSEFAAVVAELDRRFAELTEDDGGQALASLTGPVPDRWWWHRITNPPPWRGMPGFGSGEGRRT